MSIEQMLEPELLNAARLGDESAQARIYQCYSGRVLALAYRLMGQSADAQDITQESFIRCFDALHQYRGEAPFWAWLKQITIRMALSRMRSERRWHWISFEHWSGNEDKESAQALEGIADAENPSERAQRDLDLGHALAQLSQTARAVLYLYHAEGYSHGEIAAMWGKSVSFSKSQLARAHQRLRELLQAQETPDDAVRRPIQAGVSTPSRTRQEQAMNRAQSKQSFAEMSLTSADAKHMNGLGVVKELWS